MKRKVFKRSNLKNIISLLVLFVMVFGVIGLTVAIKSNDMKSISAYEFDYGAINEKGEYIKSETSLYNEAMFSCQGLEIEKDFESFAEYEVFYYRIDKSYVGRSGIQTGDYAKDKTFDNAAFARVVIYPNLEDGEEITFWNKYSLVKELDIKVLKDQSFEAPVVDLAVALIVKKNG